METTTMQNNLRREVSHNKRLKFQKFTIFFLFCHAKIENQRNRDGHVPLCLKVPRHNYRALIPHIGCGSCICSMDGLGYFLFL